MQHIGDTERLRVYHARLTPTDNDEADRDIYIAFRTDGGDELPKVAATAVVHEVRMRGTGEIIMVHLEWIEVSSVMRREGLAMELLRLIEGQHPHPLTSEGTTPEGDALWESYESHD